MTLLPNEPEAASSSIHISGKCNYRDEGETRAVFANGIPLLLYAKADKAADHYAMIHLVESGLATQQEVAAAFGCTRLTVHRAKKKYDEGGMSALVPKKKGPKEGSKINNAVSRQILALRNKGLTQAAIASRLGLKADAVRKALKRMGWTQTGVAQQAALPLEQEVHGTDASQQQDQEASHADASEQSENERTAPEIKETEAPSESTEESEEEIPVSCDADPLNRSVDRAFARMGFLEDAAPLFSDGENIPCAGVLLAVPALVQSGLLATVRKVYGSLGASFYGLRTVILTFVLMALLRIKSPEALKKGSPAEFGRLLGLDRVCEMKTLRRKLDCLSSKNKADVFGRELAKTRLEKREDALGFLYLDGHVRVYNGKRKLSKGYVTQRRLAMPAATDYWVNDHEGDPIFVVTAPANEGLTSMLQPIVDEIASLIGSERRLCIVFDRGGWSPKLFKKLVEKGINIITYRKGKIDLIPEDFFHSVSEELDGKRIEYKLHDRSAAFLDGKLWLRQVSVMNKPEHQTHIVTSRQDLSPVTIAYRMFERWRQENFFKYMAAEFALDALVAYGYESDDLERLVPNPERKEINKNRAKLRAQRERLEQEYGVEALDNQESKRKSMRGFKIANSALGREIEALRRKEAELKEQYANMPAKMRLKDTPEGQSAERLKTEKKHLTDLFKMTGYQIETDLVGMIRADYARCEDEGRKLITSAFMSSGDMEVSEDELRITLDPLSAPHRTKVIKALCEKLNELKTIFPGTKNLRLVFDVKDHGRVSQK